MPFADRNHLYETFFHREAERLAEACEEMSRRFLCGGRLLAFGRGPYASDAQHVSVEFVHPVIVGKRALPALDLSANFRPWLEAIVHPADIVMGFGPPGGDPEVTQALASAHDRGAMTLALPGRHGDFAVECFSSDPFQHQEMIEMLYHMLWETVHVFFEQRELKSEAGDAGFLYPFLGGHETKSAIASVASSIRMKVADDALLRTQIDQAAVERAAMAIRSALNAGGKLIIFGNGGSATDANDWAIDSTAPPPGLRPVPAISLVSEPAVLTAIANDVGTELIFVRQVIAHARENDVLIAISTSGGSRNVIAALEEARKRRLTTVALLGYDGGEIVRRALADHAIVVRCDYIPRIQEVQASVYHTLCEMVQGDA